MIKELGWAYFEDGHKEPIFSYNVVIPNRHVIFFTHTGKYSFISDSDGWRFARSITKFAGMSFLEGALFEEDWIIVPIEKIEIKIEEMI